jgi:hypothetical protein
MAKNSIDKDIQYGTLFPLVAYSWHVLSEKKPKAIPFDNSFLRENIVLSQNKI